MASVGSIPLGNSGASIEQASQLSQLKAGIQDFYYRWKDDPWTINTLTPVYATLRLRFPYCQSKRPQAESLRQVE